MKMKKLLAAALAATMMISSMVTSMVASAETKNTVVTINPIEIGAAEYTADIDINFDAAVTAPHLMLEIAADGAIKTITSDATESIDVNTENGKILVETNVKEATDVTALNLDATFTLTDPAVAGQTITVTVTITEAVDYNEKDIAVTGGTGTYTLEVPHECVAGTAVPNNDGTHDIPCTGCDKLVADNEACNYVDGVCSVCGYEEPVTGIKKITSVNRDYSLQVEGIIQIRQYFAFENLDLTDDEIVANGGVVVWTDRSMPVNDEEAIIGSGTSYTVELVHSGLYQGYNEFYAVTEGIPAALYSVPLTCRPYVLIDGEYYYGDAVEMSVKGYCERIFARPSTGANKTLKPALVGLLNYGAAAQSYFKKDTDNLVNADIQTYISKGWLTEAEVNAEYTSSLIDAIVEPADEMTVNFVANTITDNDNSCSLEGAISLNQYFGIGQDKTVADSIVSKKMYVWENSDYEALLASNTPLTKENASYDPIEIEKSFSYGGSKYGYEVNAMTEGIPAALIGKTVYMVLCATAEDGTEYCSGVLAHSPEEYAARKIVENKNEKLTTLLKAMVVYGDLFKTHFKK